MTTKSVTSLNGKTLLVTGAGGDIGFATARVLGELDARIALLDISSEKVDLASRELEKASIQCLPIQCDITDPDAVENGLNAIEAELGPIDGLFNNVGYQGAFEPTHQYPLDDFKRVMDINVTGAFIVLKAVTARMVKNGGGTVVNTASMAALGGPPNMLAYATSKAALLGMTQTAAKDLAPHNIRVNAISPAYMGPGFMWTRQVELQAAAGSQYFDSDPEVVEQQMIQSIPMRRYGSIEEIPGTVAFLLSDQSSYITGINIPIAGGIG